MRRLALIGCGARGGCAGRGICLGPSMTHLAKPARRRPIGTLILATLTASITPPLHAQANPVSTVQLIQEAFRGELVYTQDARELQLTLSSDITRNRLQSPGTISIAAEYGITSAWQASVEWQVPSFQLGDAPPSVLSVGVKRAWMRLGGSQVDLAAGATVSFPVAGLARANATELQSFVVLATDAAQGGVHFFLGASLGVRPIATAGNAEDASGPGWNAGIIGRIGPFRLVGELDGQQHGELCLTPGIVWRGSASLQVGVAAPVGLTAAGERPQLIAKVTYEFHSDQ